MNKVILLFGILIICASSVYARGGAGDEHYYLTTNADEVNYTPDAVYGVKCWHITTGQNNFLQIAYTIQLAAGDYFIVHDGDSRDAAEIINIFNNGASNRTYSGVITTTNMSGKACVELEIPEGPHNNSPVIQFSYQPVGSIAYENLITSGNVGIGTGHPTCKLDVHGTIRANEVRVNIPSGADFVFEEDYNLMSISELSTFVNKYHHLPQIDSATDMEEQGIVVNEFQIMLLQKIEELTLYIIEQQKEIEALKSQINL